VRDQGREDANRGIYDKGPMISRNFLNRIPNPLRVVGTTRVLEARGQSLLWDDLQVKRKNTERRLTEEGALQVEKEAQKPVGAFRRKGGGS